MAIKDTFNLSNALNSQAYAYKCWYNYNYGNNTMGISSKDMGEITQTWNSQLDNWHAVALDDENAYEIEDDDFSAARNKGRNQAEDKTGYDGKQGGQVTRTVVDATWGIAGALATTVGSKIAGNLGTRLGGSVVANAGTKVAAGAAAKAGGKVTEEASKSATQKAGTWSIAAPLALAQATLYMAKKPNKEQKEACDALQDEMTNAQTALYSAQQDMTDMGDELIDLSDKAQVYNEEANEDIEDKKSEYDIYKASYDALIEKVQNGETLTEEEKALLQELIPLMQELGIGIQTTQEETTEVTEDIYDNMGTYQDGYDNAAETVAEVQGVTDYAASFDESTRTMCYVEAGAQTLNAASGIKAGIQAGVAAAGSLGFNAWAWACAAMGASAGVMSGIGATQQFQWAGEVGTEIGMRKNTQDLNINTNDIYDESVADYEGWMSGVEELEIEMPEDMEDPEALGEEIAEGAAAALGTGEGGEGGEGTDVPTMGLGGTAGGATGTGNATTSTGSSPANDDKDKDEK